MKRMKKVCAIMLGIVMLVGVTAFAAVSNSASQDGIQAIIQTDKNFYAANEEIQVNITVTNTNHHAVKNVSIEALLPDELTLKDGALQSDTVNLGAGETLTLSCTAMLEKEIITEPGTTEEPTETEPIVTEPSTTEEPVVTEPDTTLPEGTTSEPTTEEPATVEPTTSEPATNEPTTIPGTTIPATEGPETTESTTDGGILLPVEPTTDRNSPSTTQPDSSTENSAVNPDTGDSSHTMTKVLACLAAAGAVAVAIVVMQKKNSKKATRVISLVLCGAIAISGIAATGFLSVSAEDDNSRSFTVQTVVTVDGGDYTLEGKVNYETVDSETGIEIEKFRPYDVMYYPINQKTSMNFYAHISNPRNIQLDRVTVTDTNDNLIGYLYDNGIAPDEVKNDGIYSGNLELYSDVEGGMDLLAHANEAIKSKKIYFAAPLTGHEMDILNKVSDELLEIKKQYSEDKDKLFDELEKYLKESPDVQSYNREEDCITYMTIDGMPGVVSAPGESDTLGNANNIKSELRHTNNVQSNFQSISKRKIAVIKPWDYFDDRFNAHLEAKAKEFSDKYETNVDTFYGVDTYEQMKNLSNYDMILINTHGALRDGNPSISCFAGPENAESVIHDLRISKNIWYEEEERKVDGITIKKGTIWLTPEWFLHYYDSEAKNFQNSFIYLGACKSLKNEALANNLIDLGASCVVGYTGTVTNKYEEQMGDSLLTSILNEKNVKEFFSNKDVIDTSSDPKHPDTKMKRVGDYTWRTSSNPTPDDNFVGGDGSINNPYQIATARQLDAVRNHLDSNFVLVDDIDLSEYENWEPIGGYIDVEAGDGLQGSFDGQGHTISNLKMNYTITPTGDSYPSYYFGLFSDTTLSPGIKNVKLENVDINISGTGDVIGNSGSTAIYIAGFATNASVLQNISVSGGIQSTLTCDDVYIGGVANWANRITNSQSDVDIYSQTSSSSSFGSVYIGGIISLLNDGVLNNCRNYGQIFGKNTSLEWYTDTDISCGGIAAISYDGQIINCINYTSIEGNADYDAFVGGIVGDGGYRSTIMQCANYGKISARTYVSGDSNVGGIVGSKWASNEISISKCVNFGNLTSVSVTSSSTASDQYYHDANCGGILGGGWSAYEVSQMNNCYNFANELEATSRNLSGEKDVNIGRISGETLESSEIAKASNCYSLDSTLLNGLPAMDEIGPDQKNGGSMTRAEIEKAVTDLGFELPGQTE